MAPATPCIPWSGRPARRTRAIGMPLARREASSRQSRPDFIPTLKETLMQWSQPAFEDLRFGFEITMYISNR
jgi:coenzyme PQQ precursor peptide PqqA